MGRYSVSVEGDNLFAIGTQLYQIGENGIHKATIGSTWDKNQISDYPQLTGAEAEQLFKDIIDTNSDRYNIEDYGGWVNETGFGPAKLNTDQVTSYLGREPRGTAPTREEELALRPDLIAGQNSTQTTETSFDQALMDVYAKRSDLQALYNPDGTAKNPNDPRVAGIATLQEWASKYGINEEPTLKTAQSQQSTSQATASAAALGLSGPYAELYGQLKNQLDELQKRGQVINPNVEITPQKLGEFMSQAAREIDPYYASQLKIAKDSFLSSIGYSRDEILRQEQDVERKYGQQVRNIGEDAAEAGFAQSGRRIEAERNLATDTQNTIDSNRRDLSYRAGQAARTFAQTFGSANLTNPTIGAAPRVLAGQGSFDRSQSESSPFYSLSPEVYQGLVGSQQYEQDAAKRRRASELEEAYRTKQATTQTRQLTL